MMTPVELVLSKLADPKPAGPGKWIARCPAHDDRRPSLSIAQGDNSGAVLHCHAGCTAEAVVKAIGLTMRDLMPADAVDVDNTSRRKGKPKVVSASTAKVYPTAREAVADLERRHGPRSAMWTYCDDNGERVGVVIRWDTPAGKDIRPVSRNGKGWVIGGMAAPRSLYALIELRKRPHERVYVVEGEKAADALRRLGLLATTSPHGSQSAGKAEWTPLAGRDVVILPDHDDAGDDYADDVIGLLAKLPPAPTIRRVTLPGLPDKGDAFDYIEARRAAGASDETIRAEIEALADAAEPLTMDTPAPPLAWRPFPIDALPDPLRSFVREAAKAIGCDPSYLALPLLAALASAIGGSRCVLLKRGWVELPILWCAIVGESGTLKTPAFKLALKAIRHRQQQAMKRYQEALELYDRELAEYERAAATWKKSKTSEEPPVKPKPPAAERFIVSDTTVEGLAQVLAENPRGVLLGRDELAGWIGSFDRYSKGKGGASADSSHWLSMHNGESITVDRKTGQRITYVPSAIVSIVGGIQPGILRRALGAEHQENGLAARLLLSMPPRLPKRWTEADIDPKAEERIAAIVDRLYELQPDIDSDGEPCPKVIALTADAKRQWVQFFNEHNAEQVDLTGNLAAAWSKLEGYAPRLALVLHCVRWAAGDPTLATPDTIDAASMEAAITLTRWFANEARRVSAMLAEDDDDRDRRRLVELIGRKGGCVTARELQQSDRRFKSDAGAAGAALQELVSAGYGTWEQSEPGTRGQPTRRFRLSTASTVYGNIESPAENGNTVDVDSVDTPQKQGDAWYEEGEL